MYSDIGLGLGCSVLLGSLEQRCSCKVIARVSNYTKRDNHGGSPQLPDTIQSDTRGHMITERRETEKQNNSIYFRDFL